jgi:hypothetical protein
MTTKAELLEQAAAAGVEVAEGATKAEIEAALADAGVDPTDQAPEGVTTLGGARQGGTDPQPADDPKDTVTLEGPGGTKVTAPSRMKAALKANGFK